MEKIQLEHVQVDLLNLLRNQPTWSNTFTALILILDGLLKQKNFVQCGVL